MAVAPSTPTEMMGRLSKGIDEKNGSKSKGSFFNNDDLRKAYASAESNTNNVFNNNLINSAYAEKYAKALK